LRVVPQGRLNVTQDVVLSLLDFGEWVRIPGTASRVIFSRLIEAAEVLIFNEG